MDLRTGCVYWDQLDGAKRVRPPAPDGDVECDVAVIGAGVSGALAAYHLVEAGVDTVILDRRDPARGSTAASTGLLQYEIDTHLIELQERLGADHARRAYRACVECLDEFRRLVDGLDDRCDLIPRPSLYLATDEDDGEDLDLLRREWEARRSIGIDVELWGPREIREHFPFSRPAALWSRTALEVDPYRLTLTLIESARRRGLRVFGDTTVTGYDAGRTSVTLTVETETGEGIRRHLVRAGRVVFATGYETPEFLDRSICQLKSTYALSSRPVKAFPGWHERCLLWESARPYFYARTTSEGVAMVGGEDEDFADAGARDALIPQKARALAAKFRRLFPDIPIEPDCAWAGTFAETKDGLPYIGSVPEFPLGHFALGYGGNGITFSLIAARIIRDAILGRPSADADLFRFGR